MLSSWFCAGWHGLLRRPSLAKEHFPPKVSGGGGDDRSVKIKSVEAAKIMKSRWLVLGCIETDFCKKIFVGISWKALDEIYKIRILFHRADFKISRRR